MNHFTNQSNGSHRGHSLMGRAMIRRFALFPIMLLMLLFLPAGMVAQKAGGEPVTSTPQEGNVGEQAYAVFDIKTHTLTFYCGTKPEGAYSLNKENNFLPSWHDKSNSIWKVVFDASFANARPTDCSYWFGDFINLDRIEGIENLNTEQVTDMKYMFGWCQSLESLDLTSFNTEQVTDMKYMFYNCRNLNSLDLRSFNTAKVTDMFRMFFFCEKLDSLDLTNFNTAKVTDMCQMFSYCRALTTIYASSKFVAPSDGDTSDMFKECTKLEGDIKWTEDKATDATYATIYGGYFSFKGGIPWVKYADGTLTFYHGSKGALLQNEYKLNRSTELPAWLAYKNSITQVVFDATFAEARPTTCRAWFKDCINLEKIEGIKYLNTSEVTDMGSMFERCFKLQTIDLSGFDTRKVTNMYGMFTACIKLTSLDISNFNTSEVKNMESMFHDCRKLTSLDFSHFNTANVTNMTSMFNSCTNLSSVDLSGFDTRNVKEMSNMFSYCQSLKILDLSSFNTLEKAKDSYMGDMFEACRELTTIFVSDKFVIGKSSSMMFDRCLKLKGAIAYDKTKTESGYANYKTGYFTKLVGKNGDEKIGAAGETLTADTLTLADDKDFVAYESFAAKAASYSRKMSAGTTWATLCLPFEVSLQNQNFRAFQLLSSSDDVVELQELENSIAAGTPVIIKMNEGATTLTFSETDKAIETAVAAGSSTENGKYQLVGLYQKKMFSRDADNHCYILKGGNLMNPAKILLGTSTSTVGSLPYRAYMQEKASEGGAARMFSIRIGDGTTAIKQLEADAADSKAEYYDLQGHRLQDLQKGVNIVKRGGKTMKVVIK